MKIIIIGAGRVGESVADSLVSERNDITVIDTSAARLRDLESRFDLRGVVGSGIDPAVLAEAGARDTDLLIACAAEDETNLVCCKVAQRLYGIPTRIARVDGLPMGVAGVWSRWKDPEDGTELLSFTIITINANAHQLMNRYQQPGSEKTMPAILNEGAYDAWLGARAAQAKEFLRPYPAQKLLANPVEKKGRKDPLGLGMVVRKQS